ncbi:MAG: hypothetical protein WBP22_01080 [Candidatus Saccharimonas sp.]
MVSTSIIVTLLALAVVAAAAWVVLARRDGMDNPWAVSAALTVVGLVVPAVAFILMNMGVDLNPYVNGDLRWVVALTGR